LPELIPAFRQMSVSLYVRREILDLPQGHSYGPKGICHTCSTVTQLGASIERD